jgi:hypothetical protein
MQRLSIEIGGAKFSAMAYPDKAPKTCELLETLLPIESEVMHSRFSGESIWFGLKPGRSIDYENHTSYLSRGDIVFYPGTLHGNGLLISYGASVFQSKVGLLAANHFASITSDHERLAEAGMGLLREGAKKIRITKED